MWPARVLVLVLAVGTLFAQQSYSPADVEDGGRAYRGNCAVCHGPDGDGIAGVELGRGTFMRASSDDDLIRIIRTGIQGTAMPPANFSEFQARTIVAYLRSMAVDAARNTSGRGDAARGKALFEGKGQCGTCHRVKGAGSRAGPDLTQIGSVRRSTEMEKSILEPDAEVLPQNRSFRAVTRDGTTITGRLLNQDSFAVQMLDSKDRLLSLPKTNLREHTFVTNSPMPSYRDKLSSEELADIVSYLVSLKGVDKP